MTTVAFLTVLCLAGVFVWKLQRTNQQARERGWWE